MSMPYVDLVTGKIHGCKRGSWYWWHEKGHLEFNKMESTGRLKLYQNYIFVVWMMIVTLYIVNDNLIKEADSGMIGMFGAIIFLLAYLGIDLYEEYWCNRFADKNYKRNKNDTKELYSLFR